MSASNKKKLRHDEKAAKMTERQIQAQAEAKKLNLYTTLFVVVLAVLLVAAVTVGVIKSIQGSGIRERSTTALTVNEHKLNNVEMNYYYVDAVNNFLNNYGSYTSLFGLDTTLPLDQQVMSLGNLTRLEKGNEPMLSAVIKMSDFFGVTITQMLSENPNFDYDKIQKTIEGKITIANSAPKISNRKIKKDGALRVEILNKTKMKSLITRWLNKVNL